MEFTCLLYEVKGNVAYITLNRPDVFNAFNDEQSYEMQSALKAAHRDDQVRVVVLTGAGRAFCSGQDLKAIAGAKNRSLRDSLDKRYNPIIKAMRTMPKPIIGMINGVAAGAGCSLALACDFVVASSKASFIEVFINVGLVLDSGSSYFLPRLVGSARAFEMSTMGSKITAQQALEWGIVNRVAEPEELENVTSEIVAYYEKAPTKAIALMKNMLNKSFHSDLDTMLEYEAMCQDVAGKSEDYQEGVKAFNEKRTPEFRGR
ncbi:MAG: enoyl-CoA hydratase/isomerase family protein [Flavobacteriales bacterium]|nr:enoyl-CoA hydratase/isomerase family protein [Bacteroidota bacterium]MCB9241534.1 enoyl-CoA hydratase/isomerase family protein [Flavobacteriales bacterium]